MKFRKRLPWVYYLPVILMLTTVGCGGASDQSQAPGSGPAAGTPQQETTAAAGALHQQGAASAAASDRENPTLAAPSKPEPPPPDADPMDVKGRIAFNKSAGGYYIQGVEPAGKFIIVNQDPQLLAELLKNGKTVKIEGRLAMGVDFLFIDRIDGNSYTGTREPVFSR